MKDDNDQIKEMIDARMKVGVERYGHGLRHEDDTTQWGTEEDQWTEMALEEALDLTIYLAAELIRIRGSRRGEFTGIKCCCPPNTPCKRNTGLNRGYLGYAIGRFQRLFGWER